jgi:pantoate--beta-alanine ligase
VVGGGVTEPMDGAARPGHFGGVATVVTKLLLQCGPDVAVFGEKDYQQLQVIRRLVRDLDIPVEIIGAPIARAADGLALSSRNAYLSSAEREVAGRMNVILANAALRLREGASPAETEAKGLAALAEAGFSPIDYFEVRGADDLSRPPNGPARVFAAAFVGRTRLIDNMAV